MVKGMKKEAGQMLKKVFQPVDIQVFKYNLDDLLGTSDGYNPFLGEDDRLSRQAMPDEAEKDA